MANLARDLLLFALSKKTDREKALYMLKGALFLPFLAARRASKRKKDDVTDAIGAGEDIYPLF